MSVRCPTCPVENLKIRCGPDCVDCELEPCGRSTVPFTACRILTHDGKYITLKSSMCTRLDDIREPDRDAGEVGPSLHVPCIFAGLCLHPDLVHHQVVTSSNRFQRTFVPGGLKSPAGMSEALYHGCKRFPGLILLTCTLRLAASANCHCFDCG